MTVNDRIKEVRKKFNLTQEELGEKLGVSRGIIKNIEYNVVDASTKPLLLTSICSTFGISREWLENGDDEMLAKTSSTVIDEICEKLNLNDFGKRALIAYLKLSEDEQNVLAKYAELVVSGEKSTNIVEMLSAARGSDDNIKKIQTDLETVSKLDELPDRSSELD